MASIEISHNYLAIFFMLPSFEGEMGWLTFNADNFDGQNFKNSVPLLSWNGVVLPG